MFTYWVDKNKDLIRMNSRDTFRTLLISMMEPFYENSKWFLVINYFRKNSSS